MHVVELFLSIWWVDTTVQEAVHDNHICLPAPLYCRGTAVCVASHKAWPPTHFSYKPLNGPYPQVRLHSLHTSQHKDRAAVPVTAPTPVALYPRTLNS